MDCNAFITRQLAAAGWAPIHQALAKFTCPDLHDYAGISGWLTLPDVLLRRFPRTQLVKVRIEGFGEVDILARSTLALAERISFITGGEVEIISQNESPQSNRAAWEAARQRRQGAQPAVEVAATPTPRQEQRPPGDAQGLDVAAKEPPRPCTACGNLTNGGNCLPAMRGEWKERPPHFKPSASHPRRCLLYTPGHHLLAGDHIDMRNGAELWPELLAKAPVASTTATPKPEPAGTIDKAKAIVADMLKAGARPAAEIIAAGQGASISERTIQRAAEQLGVAKAKDGNGGWRWAMPEQGARAA